MSIGVATHNGQRFVAESIHSLRAQTYTDLDVHVHDNGSRDGTLDTARDAAGGDPRFRFSKWEEDHGAVANFNHLLETAEGDYFMWASDHDLWSPEFVRKLVNALGSHPDAVLAYPKTVLIDIDGRVYGSVEHYPDVDDPEPHQRYASVLWGLDACDMIYGLMPLAVVRSTWGVLPISGPDRLLLAQLALRGSFVRVQDPLYYRRQNRGPEVGIEAERAMTQRVLGAAVPQLGRQLKPMGRRKARDAHLRLVREELRGTARSEAIFQTRSSFHYRYNVRDPYVMLRQPGLRTRRRLRGWVTKLWAKAHM